MCDRPSLIDRLIIATAWLLIVPVWSVSGQLVHDMVDASVVLVPSETVIDGKVASIEFTSEPVMGISGYSGVAVQGFAPGESLRGWIQFSDRNDWQQLYIVRSATDSAFLAGFHGPSVRDTNQVFRLRFETSGSESITIFQAGVFLDAEEVDSEQAAEFNNSGVNLIVAPTLITRQEWDASPFIGTPSPLNRPNYTRMTLHHTAGFSAITRAEGVEQVKRIQDFHQNGRGWSDIGYQFLLDQEGRLYQGRPFLKSIPFDEGPPLAHGAHVGNNNTGNIGVALMGCYHPPEGSSCRDKMLHDTQDSLITVFAFLTERYGPGPGNLHGHRDFSATSCPGDNNYEQLGIIRSDIAELLRTGNASIGAATIIASVIDAGVVKVEWQFTADYGIRRFIVERMTDAGAEIVFENDLPEDGSLVDSDLKATGNVVYALRAAGNSDRLQTLGVIKVFVDSQPNIILTQNFPNPASNSTSIRYFLDRPGFASLFLYDLVGRRIAKLDELYLEEARWVTTHLNAAGLPQGVYHYRLVVDGFAETQFDTMRPLVVAR